MRFLVALALALAPGMALGHEHWISGKRNAVNEWCCGPGDCDVVLAIEVGNYWVIVDGGEVVPKDEALPSLDGQFWRCHRPDGTRRCFFAPSPSF